ncbi:MAG: Txe/YoeB family addiction module toxin [Sphingobacteriaceae bacterium]|nr:MAG: Txe/YoeB family addiction module toxin [Sphingobacteriaceae bacterium]
MSLPLDFSDQAIEDIAFHKKSGNKAVLKKLFILLEEIADHPFTGTGKPETLKFNLSGKWSRRINQEHRLVYKVFEDYVVVYSLKDHYN